MISFSVIKPKIIKCKLAASMTINLYVNLSITAHPDHHTNKLCKFRRGSKEITGPDVFLRTPW